MGTINFMNGIGKEYTDPEQRKRYLKDNADAVVEKSYMRRFTPEELQSHKENLANIDIQINDIEQEKKAAMEVFKERLKPLQEQHAELISNIRQKATLTSGICYCFVDEEVRTTYIINEDGDCIESHPCTAEELQKSIYEPIRLATGTEG